MASSMSRSLHYVTLFLLLAQITHSAPITKPKDHTDHITYIVHANHLAKPSQFATHEHWYTSMVAIYSKRAAANSSSLLYICDTLMHRFAVIDNLLHPLTTRSPGFLDLDSGFGAWKDTDFGDGVIIGFVDTGIWPESPSFNDSSLGPVRQSRRGGCVNAEDFNATMCSNKLVGAKAFTAGAEAMRTSKSNSLSSPRDMFGHGTHVSSTDTGSEVHDVGIGVFAWGTARGVTPKARIAMYKGISNEPPTFGPYVTI